MHTDTSKQLSKDSSLLSSSSMFSCSACFRRALTALLSNLCLPNSPSEPWRCHSSRKQAPLLHHIIDPQKSSPARPAQYARFQGTNRCNGARVYKVTPAPAQVPPRLTEFYFLLFLKEDNKSRIAVFPSLSLTGSTRTLAKIA